MEVTTGHKNTSLINFVHEYHHEIRHKQFLPHLPLISITHQITYYILSTGQPIPLSYITIN